MRADFPEYLRQRKGLKEFGVELAMLDEARAVGAEFNRIAGENCLYFETGQVRRCLLALTSAQTGNDGSA